MEIKLFLDNKKVIQDKIHDFITKDNCDVEEKFQDLIKIISDQEIFENIYEIKTLLLIIVKIANNHYRTPNFFSRIEKVLLFFKDKIMKSFSNSEIFDIFKSNKRILIFLIEENIISYDQSNMLINTILNYCQPNSQVHQADEFKQKQRSGENDHYICYLIRNDLIDKFIAYVNQNSIFLSSSIAPSLFETHPLLIKNIPTLIEYSAFYGSRQIFKYLLLNNARLTPSICIYAIHGNDAEIIELLQQNYISQGVQINYNQLFIESIKCHHYDISNYFSQNFSSNDIISPIKYYNFIFFPNEIDNEIVFYYLCKYDHYQLVDLLLKNSKIDVNKSIIQKEYFLPNSKKKIIFMTFFLI